MPSSRNAGVPYFSQWESPELVDDILSGRIRTEDDPAWSASGTSTPEDYAFWSWRGCGIACLRMVLANSGVLPPPAMVLMRELEAAGAYRRDGDRVVGMIYQPFVEYLSSQAWGLEATSVAPLPLDQLSDHLTAPDRFAMVSVHASIRDAESGTPPPSRIGGHLVLVTDCTDEGVTFHNPSGRTKETQSDVSMGRETFDRYFAERGILLTAHG